MTDKEEKYMQEWKEATLKMAKAIGDGDTEKADEYKRQADEAYSRYKDEAMYRDEIMDYDGGSSFGTFESVLPELFLKGRTAIKESVRLISRDRNLMAQVKLYETLKGFGGGVDAKEFVREAVEIARKDVKADTLNESNKEFAKLLIRNGIRPREEDATKRTLAEACFWMLSNPKGLDNLLEYEKKVKIASDIITEMSAKKAENADIMEMMDALNKSMMSLNEEDRRLAEELMDVNKEQDDEKKKKLFDSIKKECLELAKKKMEETKEESLGSIIEMIETKQYNSENVVKDVAKLLEVGAMLSDF